MLTTISSRAAVEGFASASGLHQLSPAATADEAAAVLEQEYRRILSKCEETDAPDLLRRMTADFVGGRWRDYWALLEPHRAHIQGAAAVDFGCKFGHTALVLMALGAESVAGIDAATDYVGPAKKVFESLYPNVTIVQNSEGFVPLAADSADFVLMNEVVSHVNPSFLPAVWAELSRLLKLGGVLLISDGNNLDFAKSRAELPELYAAWEHGPDGTWTGRDTVSKSYLCRRAELIGGRHPQLDEGTVQYLAASTSGLFGRRLESVIDEYVRSGDIVPRPYRKGICPTNPGLGGAVMERGFHPVGMIQELEGFGLDAKEFHPEGGSWRRRLAWKMVGWLERMARRLRHRLTIENFTLLAIRRF